MNSFEKKQRILFVDDEPNIVQGLQRMLRPYRARWDMVFVQSPEEALDMVRREPFDIVISDMRMPRMNGAELLSQVREISPRAARMILSGHAELSSIVKTVGPSHQFLSKPCDPQVLAAKIEQALALRSAVHNPKIAELIGGMDTIPSVPALYQQVVTAIQNQRPLREIGQLVAQDMGMTTRLLQIVNSSYFGLARKVDEPVRAVMMLGMETLQALVLGAKVFEVFSGESEAQMADIWVDATRVAAAANRIAICEELDEVQSGQIMVASFLHDIGLVALAARAPELFAQVKGLDTSKPESMLAHERDVLGATHPQIGACLLGLWSLPDPIVEAVAFHHWPSDNTNGDFGPTAVVHAAQGMCRRLPEASDPESLTAVGLDAAYLERVGVLERFDSWIACVKEKEPGG